jgi:ABC-type nitrate/sulfonate/bicarbonate transport system substrate-binding protein
MQAEDPRKVRLAYSAFSISFLNLFVARDAGLFKKYGVEPELVQMAGPLPVAALASGEIDYHRIHHRHCRCSFPPVA